MSDHFIRLNELVTTPKRRGRYPINRSTLWRWIQKGNFPQPTRLSGGLIAWPLEVIEQHEREAATRPARTADALRAGAASVAVRRAKALA
jgi:predicted DNA-binding transcriptional regulator AlpA